jgi:hypothetical protein
MATPQQQEEALFKESRIDLAIDAYKQGQFTSFRKATSMYDVPQSTAQLRVKGIEPKLDSTTPIAVLHQHKNRASSSGFYQ